MCRGESKLFISPRSADEARHTFEDVLLDSGKVRGVLYRESLEELGVENSFNGLDVARVEGSCYKANVYLGKNVL